MLSHKVVHISSFIIIIYKMKRMIIQNNDNPVLSLGNSLVIMLNSSTTEKNSHYLCEENLWLAWEGTGQISLFPAYTSSYSHSS